MVLFRSNIKYFYIQLSSGFFLMSLFKLLHDHHNTGPIMVIKSFLLLDGEHGESDVIEDDDNHRDHHIEAFHKDIINKSSNVGSVVCCKK